MRVTVAGIVLLVAFIPGGCMVLDALGPTGPRGVTFIHTGVTDLTVGELTPVGVTVSAQGVPLPQLRLRVEISPDSTRVTLNVAGDSLIPCKSGGQPSLLVRLLHSSAVGTDVPDTSIALRVSGGGPSDARCPP